MKKIFMAFMALTAASAMLIGCSKKNAGDFVLGLDDSFPPMGYRDADDHIVGYDIDLAAEVAKKVNLNLVLQPIDWSAKEIELNTNKIDCIWNGFTITDERLEAMSFTKPYLNNSQVVVVHKDSGIKTLADMAGKKVGVQAGSSAMEAIDGNDSFKMSLKGIVEFKENVTALNDIGTGNIDGVVMDEVVASYTIKQGGFPYVILEEDLGKESYGVAFRKDDELCGKVQKALEELKADGTVAKLDEKWFGKDLSVIEASSSEE